MNIINKIKYCIITFICASLSFFMSCSKDDENINLSGSNEPEGTTELVRWDGTSKFMIGWGELGSAVEVVDDPTNPIGTGKSLQFNYEVGSTSAGNIGSNRLGRKSYKEYYIRYHIFYDPNWEFIGHKNFYWGADISSRYNVDSPTQYYATFAGDGDAVVANQNGKSENLIYMDGLWRIGEWVFIEIHAIAESVPGAGDGKLYYYFNGDPIASNENVTWVPDDAKSVNFDGFHWYNERNSANTKATWFRVGELYISGKD